MAEANGIVVVVVAEAVLVVVVFDEIAEYLVPFRDADTSREEDVAAAFE